MPQDEFTFHVRDFDDDHYALVDSLWHPKEPVYTKSAKLPPYKEPLVEPCLDCRGGESYDIFCELTPPPDYVAEDESALVTIVVQMRATKRKCRPWPPGRRFHSVVNRAFVMVKDTHKPYPVQVLRPMIANGRKEYHRDCYNASSCTAAAPNGGACNKAAFPGYSGSSIWTVLKVWGRWYETKRYGV